MLFRQLQPVVFNNRSYSPYFALMTLPNQIGGDDFTIIKGGLLDKVLKHIGVISGRKYSSLKKIAFLLVLVWLPLLVLTLMEGTLYGYKVQLTFIKEFLTHIKFLLALPLLVFSETWADNRMVASLSRLFESPVMPEKSKNVFLKALANTHSLRNSKWPDVIIIILIFLQIIFRNQRLELETTTWFSENFNNPNMISKAGIWFKLISLPVFQFLLLSWLWRWIIWIRLLYTISRISTALNPAHADRAGGIGFLGDSPLPFSSITFILSLIFAGHLAEQIIYFNEKLSDNYIDIGALVLVNILINVLPLASFFPKLYQYKKEGIAAYGKLLSRHHLEFDKKWLHSNESLLGSADISSVADFTSVYNSIEKMRVVPFDIKSLLISIAISLLPVLPVLALQYPLDEILNKIFKVIF